MPLITCTNYYSRGEAFEMIDSAGKVSRTYADHAGRTTRTIQNYVPSDPNLANPCFCPGVEQNVTRVPPVVINHPFQGIFLDSCNKRYVE